jgi:hypothetical protein
MEHGNRDGLLLELLQYLAGSMIAVNAHDSRVVRDDVEYLPEDFQLASEGYLRSLVQADLSNDGGAFHKFLEIDNRETLLRRDRGRVTPDAPEHHRVGPGKGGGGFLEGQRHRQGRPGRGQVRCTVGMGDVDVGIECRQLPPGTHAGRRLSRARMPLGLPGVFKADR